MSETFFAINDLMRRKLQTGTVVIGLALCVASTLFLLLLGDRIGFHILSVTESVLTPNFSKVFSNFLVFVGFLTFLISTVIIAFMVYVMMAQRIRDIGLMKAIGCPNDLVFGYFMNELVIVAFAGCLLGVFLGLAMDYVSTNLLSSTNSQSQSTVVNFWLALLAFVIYFVLSLIIGAKPVLDTAKVEPSKALSPAYIYGLAKESDFRGSARAGFTAKIAIRSLFRRKSATFRVILCLTVVFLLVTVAVAGGIIAEETTGNWAERAVGKDLILLGHRDMCDRYKLLLSRFYQSGESADFNYTDTKYLISDDLLNQMSLMSNVTIDQRLVLEGRIQEVEGYTVDPKLGTRPIGDNREGGSLIIGVDPQKTFGKWIVDGESLGNGESGEAMIGDLLAQKIFSAPLLEKLSYSGQTLKVVGVCLDPINNGNVVYIPLRTLQNAAEINKPNVLLVRIDPSGDRLQVLNAIRSKINASSPDFELNELNQELSKAVSFLGNVWSMIMLLPLSVLASASLCLIGYVVLSVDEQRQEFGILRAIGMKPNAVVKIVSTQNFMILLSSYAVGLCLGIIATLLVLIPEPLVTDLTVMEIAGWLVVVYALVFVISLFPVLRFAGKPILEMMRRP
jgi:ABC-type antimicrobial peptide transport system permease subunit